MTKSSQNWQNFCNQFDYGRRIKFKNPVTKKIHYGYILEPSGAEWYIVRPSNIRRSKSVEYIPDIRRTLVHINDIVN